MSDTTIIILLLIGIWGFMVGAGFLVEYITDGSLREFGLDSDEENKD